MAIGDALSVTVRRVVEPVEGMHGVIAGRWFDRLEPVSRPVRAVHDRVTRLVYGSIRFGSTVAGAIVDACMADGPERGGAWQALVNGLWGDSEPSSAVLSLRNRRGTPLWAGTAVDGPASGHIVVLVHGLVETERRWFGTTERPGFVEALSDFPALTPVTVRYNTGLPVETNGALLATAVEEMWGRWPEPIESIALVGHSMGGLVVRAACSTAQEAGHRWLATATDLITIGTPHLGTPLESLVGAAASGLGLAATTRPLARFIERRSGGIKDLRSGRPLGGDVPAGVRQHFVAGVVASDPGHPIGRKVGDLMVPLASGTGDATLEPASVFVLGGVHHFDLLHDPAVIDQVMSWLTH